MRILMAAAGSRGDVAPVAGLGTALRRAGYDVAVATYGTFEDLVTGCGLEFRPVPGDPELLGASDQGQRWQEGGTGAMSGVRFIRLIAEHTRDVNAAILQAARQSSARHRTTGSSPRCPPPSITRARVPPPLRCGPECRR
jgi:sterol 3beta-glucosyltransferase